MGSSISMNLGDMETEISRLKLCAENFESTTESMTASVGTLCDGWSSDASDAYHEDYTTVAASFAQTIEVVRGLISSIESYIGDVRTLEQTYGQNKVVPQTK